MTDGKLYIVQENMVFKPYVYPTKFLSQEGFKWDKREKAWTFPLSYYAYKTVTRYFDDIEISEDITKFLYDISVVKKENTIENSSLLEFQKEGAYFIRNFRRALLGFSPRLGKTYTAIIGAKDLEGFKLVIAPLSLLYYWKEKIEELSGDKAVIWHGKSVNWKSPEGKWIVSNIDTVRNNFVEFKDGKRNPIVKVNMDKFSVVIADESILYKNRNAKRSKSLKEICKNVPYVWLLSGSPVSKFLDDMWMQLSILYPKRYSNYWKFTYKYCIVEDTQWGKKITGNKHNAFEELKRDLSDVMISRTIDQVLDLPEWSIENIPLPMGSKQYRAYKQMEDHFFTILPDSDETVLAMNVLAQLTRLIQLASNTSLLGGEDHEVKWSSAIEMVDWVDLPCILWITYKKTSYQLSEMLTKKKISHGILNGDVSLEDRKKYVDEFQNGNLPVIIAHPGVGKFGLTLSEGKTSIYVERNYNGDDYYQSLYRIRGIGDTVSPQIYHLLATTPDGGLSVDGVIDKILKFRKDQSVQITTGLLKEFWE